MRKISLLLVVMFSLAACGEAGPDTASPRPTEAEISQALGLNPNEGPACPAMIAKLVQGDFSDELLAAVLAEGRRPLRTLYEEAAADGTGPDVVTARKENLVQLYDDCASEQGEDATTCLEGSGSYGPESEPSACDENGGSFGPADGYENRY